MKVLLTRKQTTKLIMMYFGNEVMREFMNYLITKIHHYQFAFLCACNDPQRTNNKIDGM